MHTILIPAALNVLAIIACGLALWLGQPNHRLPQLPAKGLRPFDKQLTEFNKNAVFKTLDRIPLLRRSGNATVNDLGKALLIVLIISFVPAALTAPLFITLWASAFLLSLVAVILFMHPALSHRQSFKDNARGRSPLKH